MFCLRSVNPAVSSSILKLAANHGVCQSHCATHICAPASMLSFGGRGRQSFGSQSPPLPESLPLDVLVDEENVPGYRPQYFYPANPGDVLNRRYELKAKIGWGSSSTVWLAPTIAISLLHRLYHASSSSFPLPASSLPDLFTSRLIFFIAR
jgi:hypothetical protein